jgi:hypothetical protein
MWKRIVITAIKSGIYLKYGKNKPFLIPLAPAIEEIRRVGPRKTHKK